MIGVFDSGVGGLTVVKEIFKYLPDYQIIYFGDTARLPYGTRGAGFVKKYSIKITDWLLNKGAKIIVVACHTSSAWASDCLKEQFKEVPIFEVISPATKEVLESTKNKRVGVIGTPGSIKSNAWKKKILGLSRELMIYPQSCPLFVPLVEEGWVSGKVIQDVAKKYLTPLKAKKIDTLVLACTHYPLLRKAIQKVLGRELQIVNPAESLAKELKLFLKKNPQIAQRIKKGKNHQFFFSDEPYNLEKISQLCFKQKIKMNVIDPF